MQDTEKATCERGHYFFFFALGSFEPTENGNRPRSTAAAGIAIGLSTPNLETCNVWCGFYSNLHGFYSADLCLIPKVPEILK